MKIGLKILICFMLLVSCSEDQIDETGTGAVKGRVVDARTYEGIENARISSSPTTSTVFSDKDGYFEIDNITMGKYSFQAQKDGFTARFEPATVEKDITVQIIFELQVSTANNKPPDVPILTAPTDNATGQSLTLDLTWTAKDPESDPMTYTVTVKNGTTDETKTYANLKDTKLNISGLSFSTKYYWQVTADDGINKPINSVTNSFTTLAFPNPRYLYVKKVKNNNVIYTADEAGNELQLSSAEVNSYRPRKNLSINRIAYISSDGSLNQIFTMNPDGTDVKKITNFIPIAGFNMEYVNYCWSTNGRQIIYPNFDRLYRIDSDGSGLIQLFKTPNGKFISECEWSQDGSQIVLKVNDMSGYNVEIYVINTAGDVLYQVLSGVTGGASGLSISVDNSKIAYTRDVSGFENSTYRRLDSRIFIYTAADNTSTELASQKPNGFNDFDVKFSPNEAELIYVNTSNDGLSANTIQKVTISSSNSNGSRTTLFQNASMPDWR
ncbi:carboxypeptidase regulatory-like domain-containing protein [Flavobacterium tructae]|uniref:carboxypeptidase regulatory-like domain-containing protein n=1 Tax=Flavobacterium tructae TaxID=1114873 RepID=UPI002551F118|nr:carboxypeptidase regulatory-like domain-containing protein [Flavobacterium tructae]MDL2142007.1 carboxypeptidase regulatory-like domain-containing protein [Flavobacterium tructae]